MSHWCNTSLFLDIRSYLFRENWMSLKIIDLDEDIMNADWTKTSWDLPPYKSEEFMGLVGGEEGLENFRKLPVYQAAVKQGLIVHDEWAMSINLEEETKTIDEYRKLVENRKSCSLCKGHKGHKGLRNPATVAGSHDSDQIGPWSLWQGNLDSDIVVVGQDWGDISYFEKGKGRDKPAGNRTNENLQTLLKEIGVEIQKPCEPQNQVVFLTNIILCLKTDRMQGRVDDQWFTNCSRGFFRPLMEIIRPKVIIALGKKTSEAILALYGISYSKSAPFSKMLDKSPYNLANTAMLFPVYHCGARSVNLNRSMPEQREDWSKIAKWLENKDFR